MPLPNTVGLGGPPRTWPARRFITSMRKAAANPDENLIPLILDAVKSYATLGEISDAMRDVFGEHRESDVR